MRQENSLTSGINIKIGLKIALLMIGAWFVHKMCISVISVIGFYILIRSVFSIIRLSIKIIFYLFSDSNSISYTIIYLLKLKKHGKQL